jgi:hypothetical protein
MQALRNYVVVDFSNMYVGDKFKVYLNGEFYWDFDSLQAAKNNILDLEEGLESWSANYYGINPYDYAIPPEEFETEFTKVVEEWNELENSYVKELAYD